MNKRLYLLYFPGFFDGDVLIGLYDNLGELKAAYERVLEDKDRKYEIFLKNPDTKLTVLEFDREKQKFVEVDFENLLKEIKGKENHYKKVRYIIDNEWQYLFFTNHVDVLKNGVCICEDRSGQYTVEDLDFNGIEFDLYFRADSASDIIRNMGNWWGGWNDCPSSEKMANIIEEWESRHGVELVEVAHDRLSFKCKKEINEIEADRILKDLGECSSNALDISDYQTLKKKLIEEGVFSLWWD